MRTLRLSLAGVMALSLVGGAVGVSAADEVAVGESATPPVWVTLTEQQNCSMGSPSEYSTGAGEAKRLRGLSLGCDNTYTDPRVSGRGYVVLNEDCFEDGICVNWGTTMLRGPDGNWTGWWHGIDDEADNISWHTVTTGTGAYEGLTFVIFTTGVWGEFPNEYGVIYEGDPPRWSRRPPPSNPIAPPRLPAALKKAEDARGDRPAHDGPHAPDGAASQITHTVIYPDTIRPVVVCGRSPA